MTKRILIICGRKQSGKDTLGNFLVANASELFGPNYRVRKFALADPLKDSVHRLFGIPLEWMNGTEEDKNRLTTIRWKDLPHWEHWGEEHRWEKWEVGGGDYLTVRELLQQFGTEIIRKMYPHAWIHALQIRIRESDSDLAVITDCRFPNEVKAVKGWGGKVIRLTRNQDVLAEHESEWVLDRDHFDWDNFDAVIHNHELGIETQKVTTINILRQWGWVFQGESK